MHPEIIKIYIIHLFEGRTKYKPLICIVQWGDLKVGFMEYGPTISYLLLLVSVYWLFLTGEVVSDLLYLV